MKKISSLLLSLFLVAGCAAQMKQEEQKQAEEAKKQEPADTPQDIAMRAASIFENAPDLTDEQKDKLHTIYTKVYDESMEIRREIGQYKSLLYMTLVKVDYKSSEVDRITKKIVALDKKRLDIMFQALRDVQKIVGRGVDKEKVYKQLGQVDQ